jgi:hypothetical protein
VMFAPALRSGEFCLSLRKKLVEERNALVGA